MKNHRIILILLILVSLLLSGCKPEQKQRIYYIGTEYTLNACNIKVELDTEKEQFIFYYTDKEIQDSSFYYYSFTFTYDTIHTVINSPEFIYTDNNGDTVDFDESGHYIFKGNKEFYISYKYANSEIKEAISSGSFEVDFGIGPFVLQ